MAAAATFPGRAEEWVLAATCEADPVGLDECAQAGLLVREAER
ncbi:MAG TPA: hypothetical protein VG295_05525 [Solirubrobacteraceae bacterium]|nr:hypothetical protein [Solirubrobacteraceae bacterium]